MKVVTTLEPYADEDGNIIEVDGSYPEFPLKVIFRGKNNRLVVNDPSKLRKLDVYFEFSEGFISIGKFTKNTGASWGLHVGLAGQILIGNNVSTAEMCHVFSAEGSIVRIGNDCMIAGSCRIRSDDAHAVYGTEAGERINPCADVTLEEHVWLAYDVMVLAGVTIGSGTTVGTRSLVTRSLPNNVIAVGSPAKITRVNTLWGRDDIKKIDVTERESLSVRSPKYWRKTVGLLPHEQKYLSARSKA